MIRQEGGPGEGAATNGDRSTLPPSAARPAAALTLAAALLASPAAAASGDLLWEHRIGARTIHCPSAVAAGGVLYTWSNVLVKRGREIRPLLQARRVKSGELLWEAHGRESHLPAASIVEEDGRLFTAESMFEDKDLHTPRVTSRDAITGRVAWTAELDGPLERFYPTGLAAAGGRLFLLGQLSRSPGSYFGVAMVIAFDGRTGEPLWSDILFGGRSDARASTVMADRQRTVVTAYRYKAGPTPISLVRTYDAATGRLLWQRKGVSDLGQRVLHRERLFTTSWVQRSRHTNLRALDADTGRTLWRRRIQSDVDHRMEVTRRNVVVHGRNDFRSRDVISYLWTLDRESGRLLWRSTEAGTEPEGLLASPSRVFTASFLESSPTRFALDSYDALTGRRLWSTIAPLPEGTIGCDLLRDRGVLIATAYRRHRTILRAFLAALRL